MEKVNVIGAGLAGVEAVHQLVRRGIPVRLYEMRPVKMTDAHKSEYFAELVCSNSLRADGLNNAVGVLKEEMRMNDSLIIKFAREHQVPAGGSLAVDREGFAKAITEYISSHPLVEVIHEEVTQIPEGPTIIASGPLTSEPLSNAIKELLHEDYFYFYDAAAPIVTKDSIDFDKAYYKSRYDKGDAEYINCPMTEEEFDAFYDALMQAEVVKPKDFEEIFFEGCMPFEEMARRGKQTLLFGPMKPVGLEKDGGKRSHAVVQLRQDNAVGSLYNIVGFQTHLKWGEQDRIIHMIPGLENAKIVRYGVMHRNCFICSPRYLKQTYQYIDRDDLFFAGQMTGVEGYVESAQSGMVAGMNMARYLNQQSLLVFPRETVMGSLAYYITHGDESHFQPMKANFGILPDLATRVKKKEKKQAYATRAIDTMKEFLANV
ncbi:MAG: methylenetetrahydrofolate--tRNA-(uracil(54)-C(5))-methyltransferase (FADH(2)-oxidizing) TrmFO [Longibaculum muris]|uniref:Methylenetetrahydrofolate--tRNA-(uracil-5-)-methyltransferase TrmFO n=1 Tax=Longibaculum muris TaxID=1796628 RepID=A0A4R3YZK8_9FIRM|nr:methylenetetrahydrofolate--tRNA-(uracil(54)-C(5))-methyltransferase (FADH(2)-oxidizing) TrmFO [Longibaculum muris]KXU40922.1 tRNA:m(5)U-54 methyltransferase [Candidatus Stoquefichus sp. KLE1796]MBS5368432.1 methylenetetrahydrofolate--tRNA-(uracil(54)-C(5))-methyltransferase (FADH(2)-oxidizing) TrmFO [Coprobacillus cateniformis]MCR1888675.1 methylenetetrahydrofolate--tRNA-(uracil(54)-C(5))-methyltransferase (FADH(2)-oxidizing) TrmFO [Longibaculum muris]MED9812696.1 methylenetetrahydrofolate--